MAEVSDAEEVAEAPKGGKGGLLVGLIGALVAGGGGFFATSSGMLDGILGSGNGAPMAEKMTYAFVPLDPILVSLGPTANARALKFTAQIEVEADAVTHVELLRPRIIDLLNDYLRAVDESELEDPASLSLLRAQMLRRIQTIVGDGRVRDLLIIEFVLN